MKIYKEEILSNLEYWSSPILNAKQFTPEELNQITAVLESLDGDGYSETDIKDLMQFEYEYLARLIGLEWDSKKGKIIR